jgi:di/tricarboxylate transporter
LGHWINEFEETAIAILLGLMTLITFTNVVLRYGFNTGLIWGLEATTFLFAWLVLFGVSYAVKVIAVMIIGAGLDKTGLMSKVAGYILKLGGAKETRIVPIISGSVGVISSFMQNVGAAALFLPVLSRISVRAELPMSRLLMPMGFCAILGGTITMVGSSPLILLNDLMGVANAGLPDEQQMRPFELFDVTPIGLSLIVTGILYFMLLGRWILPRRDGAGEGTSAQSMLDYVKAIYGLKAVIFEVKVPEGQYSDWP